MKMKRVCFERKKRHTDLKKAHWYYENTDDI